MSNVILVIWTIVGYAGTHTSTWKEYDWRPIGGFEKAAACHEAARQLDKKPGQYRCLRAVDGSAA